MKKIALVAAMLMLAAPALARVDILCEVGGDQGGQVTISYQVVGEPNRIRAFAFDITVSDGNIVDINNFKTGVSVVGNKGYGIFPHSFDQVIVLDIDGNPTNWGDPGYTPLAEADFKGALGGLDTNGITIEMGALYDPANPTDAPDASGVLCTITVSKACAEVSIAANEIRGVVSERVVDDPGYTVDVNAPGGNTGLIVDQTSGGNLITQDMYDLWKTLPVETRDCWCYDCHWGGDTDGNCTVNNDDIWVAIDGWAAWEDGPCADTDNNGTVNNDDIWNIIDGWASCGDCTVMP